MKFLNRILPLVTVLVLAGWFAAGCSTPAADASRTPSDPSHSETRLRTGDQLTIRIDSGGNQPTMSLDCVIDENGEISLPLINHVKAAGQTPTELSDRIHANYVPRFYVNVTVTVLATQRFFYMGGEIRSPGRMVWSEDVTLLKAINMAGGFTDFANRGRVQVSRDKKNMTFNAEELREHPERDITVQPGDSVWVPRSIF